MGSGAPRSLYHYVYETRHSISGRIYVGCKSTKLWPGGDRYLGSGVELLKEIDRFGQAAFDKRVLAVYDHPFKARAHEAWIVTKEFCQRADTYNKLVGGGYASPEKEEEMRDRMSKSRQGFVPSKEHRDKIGQATRKRKVTELTRARCRAGQLGKEFTKEHRDNLKKAIGNMPVLPCEVCGKTMKKKWFDRYRHGPGCKQGKRQ